MKLFLITAQNRNELKNMPPNLSEEAALIWLGAYIQLHHGNAKLNIERREHGINIRIDDAQHFYRLETIELKESPKASK